MALSNYSFVLKNDGTLWACGQNSSGQLGLGDTTNKNTFTKIIVGTDVSDVKKISCGANHSLILKNDDTLWSCGQNSYGQLGLGDTTDRNTFTKVNISDVKKVPYTNNYSFVLKNDGTLWACGQNSSGQLGLGDTTNKNTFTKVDVSDVRQVYCGANHSFILKNDGTLWSCGQNSYGQLGLGDTTNKNTFTKVDVSDVKKISCGARHTFMVKNDDTLWVCGQNSNGQLGLGDTTNKNTFTKVDVGVVKKISCGYNHSLILKNDGTLWGCGYNYYGQLGLGDTTNKNTFTKVNISDVKKISCGYNHSLILKNDGTLWACGQNYYGQLGLGDTNNRTTFTSVNITNVKEVNYDNEIQFLIKSNNIYYTIVGNTLVETTLDFENGATLEDINDNFNILPDKFSLLNDDMNYRLSLTGLKENTFMISPKTAIEVPALVNLRKIAINSTTSNAKVKLVVSTDNGKTYYTYSDNKFNLISINIPNKNFPNFTSDDILNWNNSKSNILENGIDITTLDTIDFSKLGLLYGDFKLKYALAIKINDIDSIFRITNISMTYAKNNNI